MNQPLRVLLDTNGYDPFLEDSDLSKLLNAICANKILVYGFKVVRQELRDIPKNILYEKQNFRIVTLKLYDKIVQNHEYGLTPFVEKLAQEYSEFYAGTRSKDKMRKDFLIVACASIHQLDVLASNGHQTMLSDDAIKTYTKVNIENELPLPTFYSVDEFKKLL